jgi:hypothetical protein
MFRTHYLFGSGNTVNLDFTRLFLQLGGQDESVRVRRSFGGTVRSGNNRNLTEQLQSEGSRSEDNRNVDNRSISWLGFTKKGKESSRDIDETFEINGESLADDLLGKLRSWLRDVDVLVSCSDENRFC